MKKSNELSRLKVEVINFNANHDDEIEAWRESIKKRLFNLYHNDKRALQKIEDIKDATAFASMYADDIGIASSTLETRLTTAIDNITDVIDDLLLNESPKVT